jgi:uncharacterized membrane protein YphA (DoxX/SURF4 family)
MGVKMMKNEKVKLVIYWIVTVLVAANYLFAGPLYVMAGQEIREGMGKLGYPIYFVQLLGVWKFLGGITILAPKFPRLKEWAYAGMFFNLTAAAFSNGYSGSPVGDIVAPLITLVFVMASWYLRPASRKV